MLWIELEEHTSSSPLSLTTNDVHFIMEKHAGHIKLQPLLDGRYVVTAGPHVGYIVLSDTVISIRPKIPNDNLIYMLSYLFQIPSGENIPVDSDSENPLLDIIAMVLINRVKQLIKKGMFRGYIKRAEHLSGLKGKMPLAKNLVFIDKLFCEFDELSYSVFVNIIIKATLHLLLKMHITSFVKEEARTLVMMMSEIKDVELDEKMFKGVGYSRLNLHYKPLIDFCYLIYRSINIRNSTGDIQFSSFILDMNVLFEEFIRVYLQKTLHGYKVSRRTINNWAIGCRQELLPVVEPDIVIDGKLIIDVKYYRNVLTSNGKFISANLYQILTYMSIMNLPGLLIYPLNDVMVDDGFTLAGGETFSIYTLDLQGTYSALRDSLDKLVSFIFQLFGKQLAC